MLKPEIVENSIKKIANIQESIIAINKGNGQFEEKRVLRFPPMYGSSFFELVDFNKDGFQDFIYTCGDNADYSQVLKPYHGIYIYLRWVLVYIITWVIFIILLHLRVWEIVAIAIDNGPLSCVFQINL